MSTIRKIANGPNAGKWQAQLRPVTGGRRITKTAATKAEVKSWLDAQTAAVVTTGMAFDRRNARMTTREWCEDWLRGYHGKPATVRQAEVHVKRIVAEFGDVPMAQIRPSNVKRWMKRLSDEGLAESYVYALHARLSQLIGDAIADGILVTPNPCSRKTAPKTAKPRPYVATHEQVQALVDAFPEHLRPAVLLGAFAGLRDGEVCGLRTADVDWLRGVITPAVQYPAKPLKTAKSATPIPIPTELVEALSASVARFGGGWVVSDGVSGQASTWAVQRAMRAARRKVAGLPDGFRHHDLRHYFASFLIASGADVKVVQERLRHESAKVTLDTYGHLWPDSDDSTRTAVAAAMRQAGVGAAAAS